MKRSGELLVIFRVGLDVLWFQHRAEDLYRPCEAQDGDIGEQAVGEPGGRQSSGHPGLMVDRRTDDGV